MTSGQDASSGTHGVVQEPENFFVLHAILDRTDLDFRVEAVPDFHRTSESRQRVAEGFVDILVNVKALNRQTDLAAVREGRPENGGGGFRDVDILEYYGRIVAAKLQSHALEIRGRAGKNFLAGGDRSGERNLIDSRMRGHPRAKIVAAGKDVQDAGRENVAGDLSHLQCRKRGVRRGFLKRCIAGVQRLRDTAHRNRNRNVPRRDDADDAQWSIAQLDATLCIVTQDLGGNFQSAKALDLKRRVGEFRACRSERLSLLSNQQWDKFFDMLLERLPEPLEIIASFPKRQSAPTHKSAARCFDSRIELRLRCVRALCENLSCGRIDDVKGGFARL